MFETGSLLVRSHLSFSYSSLACFRMGMSGSASFQSVRKSISGYFLFADHLGV